MARVLLLLPTGTYRAPDFIAAAQQLGVEVVVGSERRQALARSMGDRAVVVPFGNVDAASEAIAALHRRSPLDAVLAVDDPGTLVAATAARRLGLRHNPPEAVAATRDKRAMRRRFAAAGLPQPDHAVLRGGADPAAVASEVGYPCVLKPLTRSGSQGVIRADDADQARAAAARITALLGECDDELLIEAFVPGTEVAVEGLLHAGTLEVLALFDKPDPLDGPYFEETIYVTPSGQPPQVVEAIGATVADAARALGLTEGPVHAEVRITGTGQVVLIEVAARSIGGLCARTLRFGAGISLEELIIRHAIGLGTAGMTREPQPSGVMMLPIGQRGVLEGVDGTEQARAVPGIVGLEISIPPGRPVVPLPEGDRYLGFAFARAASPAEVVAALRQAEACLSVRVR
ncbi:MAG TPA: ATP-grasp domain-containing protein [Acidimicrobiales bacterium]|jgi:biotin carboxylase